MVLSEHEKQLYISALEQGRTSVEACGDAGVNIHAVDNLMWADEEFRNEVRKRRKLTRYSPKKFTAEKKEEFLQHLRDGKNIITACGLVGVVRDTIHDHRALDPDFDQAIKQIAPRAHPEVVFTEPCRERFLESIRIGNRRSAAAKNVGIRPELVRDYIIKNPDFLERVEKAEADSCDLVEDALWKNAIEGNFNAQKFWLINRLPNRWTDTKTTKQIGGDTVIPLQVNVNIFEEMQRLALEYETKFNEARKLTAGESRELAAAVVVSNAGGVEEPRLVGSSDATEDSVGEQVHPPSTVCPAKEVPGV